MEPLLSCCGDMLPKQDSESTDLPGSRKAPWSQVRGDQDDVQPLRTGAEHRDCLQGSMCRSFGRFWVQLLWCFERFVHGPVQGPGHFGRFCRRQEMSGPRISRALTADQGTRLQSFSDLSTETRLMRHNKFDRNFLMLLELRVS